MKTKTVHLPDKIGKGYATFWNFKGRYRAVKGSRASKKSTTASMNLIYNIMKYPESNGLVVRKTFRTLKDSCFAQLKWAIARLEVEHLWKSTVNPLELIYLPTGQKILFRGLDDPLKVTSVTVDTGYLCFLWIEEAYEITKEEDFNMLDESIRGEVPAPLFKQITLTFNPWNQRHWLKKRFFDPENDPDILAMTTNYKINEWLDDADKKVFERMKIRNPKRYKVAGLGEWGIVEGIIFENWQEKTFRTADVPGEEIYGLDFGFTNDPSALFCGKYDQEEKTLYVFDEFYEKGLTNERIAEKLYNYGLEHTRINCDIEPKSIQRLRTLGINKARPARKGPDSINAGIDFLQDINIIVHPRCVNFITEISNYTWAEDKDGNLTNKPNDYMNHLMDAMRYAIEPYMRKNKMLSYD